MCPFLNTDLAIVKHRDKRIRGDGLELGREFVAIWPRAVLVYEDCFMTVFA